jgi:hypothetical protein
MTDHALELYQPATPAFRAGALDYPTMLELGKAFAASGLFPGVKDQGVAVIKILAGSEMGLEPVAAMNGIDIIPGRGDRGPRMRPNADVQAWLAARAGYTYRPIEHTAEKCVLEWTHDGKVIGTSEFTVAQARKAGLVRDGGAWNTWPEPMTLARAITHGVKLYCRHVLAGHIGGMPVVTTDELEQEYPDPRDDIMRALFATYREVFPTEPEMSADEARDRRLDWSSQVLGRYISTWNGPEAPETLTRVDVQTLLDALQSSAEEAADQPPRVPWTGEAAPAEHHTQSSAGDVQSREAGPEQPPAEHVSEREGGEKSVTPDMPAAARGPSLPSEHNPFLGPIPGMAGGYLSHEQTAEAGPKPAAPIRKRRRTDPGGAPSVAQVREHQKAATERRQTTVERADGNWIQTVPMPEKAKLLEMFHFRLPDAAEFVAKVVAQDPDLPSTLAEWTGLEWPRPNLAALMETARAETTLTR